MKIIHVGNFPIKARGAFQHGVALKLSNGLIRNGHQVINFCDRDVARANGLFNHRKFGIKPANRILHRLCLDTGPDLLLLGHADVIAAETIAMIRNDLPKLRVVQWNVDPLIHEDNLRRLRSKVEVVDATLVSSWGEILHPLARSGMALGFLPNPVDFSIESGHNHEIEDLGADIFYACGYSPGLRKFGGTTMSVDALITLICAEIPGIRCRLGGVQGASHLYGRYYQAALESAAIGLNISCVNDVPLYSSDRLAQMIGNGMAVCVDRATGYDALFSDRQLVFFSTVPELIDRVRDLMANPTERQAIATAGRARYHALFNEQIVARYITEVAFGALRAGDYEWPTLL